MAGTGGRGPAGHPAGWVTAKVRGRGTDLGRCGVPRQRLRAAAAAPVQDRPGRRGVVLYIGTEASQALQAIRPARELLDPGTSVFGMTTRHIGNRVRAAAKAAGLGEGYTGHSGRVGMAQDLANTGTELPALMTAEGGRTQDASALHRTPSGRPRRCRQILPGRRKLDCHESNSRNHR